MSAQHDDDVERFAAQLRGLKERTDRSYGALARRLGMNTSTLHRYCAGDAVPVEFAPVERFAALCGASAQERHELHRVWLLAVAARQRARTADAATAVSPLAPPGEPGTDAGPEGAAPVAPADEHGPDAGPEEAIPVAPAEDHSPDAGPEELIPVTPADERAQDPVPDGTAPPAAPGTDVTWYRRRRTVVAAAVAAALLATLGSLSALPSGDRPAAAGARGGSPSPGTSEVTPSPGASSASPSPSASGSSPAPSREPEAKGGTPGSPLPSGRTSAPGGAPDPSAPAALPLTWTSDSHAWALGCGHDYVIDRPPAQVPPPPAAQDARAWAAAQGAVHGRDTNVRITVQGKSTTAVVLEALRVRVVGRAAPVPGTSYAMDQGCGGSISPRYFDVDLDKDRPIARSVPGSDEGTVIPAVKLPYRVSSTDPEVLEVTARTTGCACDWYLELDWSSQGRTGTVRIDDGGRPFRTSAIGGLDRYQYDTIDRRWIPYPS
ncbi:helix-turn-helix domain-containing protein [Streptomyces sp. NPDC048290]|uniref:transcriptional regulator n=1 Tax=Streptomyces sp. NPDC048290 TaxID=3155811 RepID=UPI00341EDB3D